jgi:hypothetical protein
LISFYQLLFLDGTYKSIGQLHVEAVLSIIWVKTMGYKQAIEFGLQN